MTIIAVFLLIIYIVFIGFILKKTFEGDAYYILLYILFFLPFYLVFQLIIFKGLPFKLLVTSVKYSKDIVMFLGFFIFLFGTKQSLVVRKWQLTFLDKLFLGFMTLTLFYMLIPLGGAPLLSKIAYAKNIFLIGVVYFLGRNTKISSQKWQWVLKGIIGLTFLAFLIAITEKMVGLHLHHLLDYANYNLIFNNISPQGNYGLVWTFQIQSGFPRYGAYFSDPLEFAASLLLFLSATLYLLTYSKYNSNRYFYMFLLLLIATCFYMAYSRASIIAGVGLVFFVLLIEQKYKLLFNIFLAVILVFVSLFFYAAKETQYFILDTLNFQNGSSLGHLFEWYQGVNSMIQNPMGIGLAMSGNAYGVDQSLKIGGENQFLIYGVQMGLIGLFVYIMMLFRGIKDSIKVYKNAKHQHIKSIAYIAAATKLGLLIPLFTANAELYLFVALFTWFLIGNVQIYLQKE